MVEEMRIHFSYNSPKKKNFFFYVLIFIIFFVIPNYSYILERKSLFLTPRLYRKTYKNFKKNSNKLDSNQKLFIGKCFCNEHEKKYDVIVIGGGHGGCEASYISAKLGAKTLLITQCKESIGEMSCNPSIGGIGKGILVKEIDALGGLMGKVIDKSGIHFKILNLKKGLAVRGHRAQADRDLYNYYMKEYMFNMPNLYILENTAHSLLIENSMTRNDSTNMEEKKKCKYVYGIKNKCSCEFYADNVILTTGTFLGGICHIGKDKYKGGRIKRILGKGKDNQLTDAGTINSSKIKKETNKNKMQKINDIHNCIGNNNDNKNEMEPNSIFYNLIEESTKNIATQLKENNFEIKRMKTGTPPRLCKNSINFDILEKEGTEKKHPFYFSFLNSNKINNNKTLPCYKTYTNIKTHELVIKYLNELPDFDCYDKLGNGPRYCPSIAKKVTKFSEKKKHIIWLEPEGFNNILIYPNGLSSAYPLNRQQEIINSIKGLENAKILFPAYDVEYFYVNPKCLNYTLETKIINGLFLSGQICGTTGYEEAACQGIVAGINAALNSLKKKNINISSINNFVLTRNDSYIGVLIHDLINKGITEPYRMFTSRAEYRLYLRPDNADIRLTPKVAKLGIASKERLYILNHKYYSVNKIISVFKKSTLNNSENQKLIEEGTKKRDQANGIENNSIKNNDDSENVINDLSHISDGILPITNITNYNIKHKKKLFLNSNEDKKKNETIETSKISDRYVDMNNNNNDTYPLTSNYNTTNINIELNTKSKGKNGVNTVYNILKSGIECSLNVLQNKLKEVENDGRLKNIILNKQNNLDTYIDNYDIIYNLNFNEILINNSVLETACAEVKYSSYLKKQINEINKIKNNFNLAIPKTIKYDRNNFPYLSNEEIEKLTKFRPSNLNEANKIEGVTMSGIYYLYHYIKKEKKEKNHEKQGN
ncbi:glucose inhibited division protein a homologue, putative [Plasmodium berghei]|uniref:Glucose inhibited division protein a homologue, putative n=2 Tax=Plasmodium berghei TaxID=5821 RepID=A0A509AU39_PLABA|nr:glucose inhibited division protein a homologue, putative [Plasmodium berghei ANKA]CXJ27803.1 glucose inhibited division protein a homologue, putative [Plasmodium berghei]SCM27020.1 glucose inhibited division protein a homologue, putative [Plasmodium berghei]SCN28754.1 glucose inhibited division protein a homologue, putative [Plasmodium berghei]SCO63022.1 glucose inhibited division protein a homologue, putative [Plasmodium berghei]SCO64501.1 glucose inhibited division protein a homologue, pu|eukprot:XP_034424400.1 glucose inhibited division protein a homologue, putative [Plasmodium berghei ANKA]